MEHENIMRCNFENGYQGCYLFDEDIFKIASPDGLLMERRKIEDACEFVEVLKEVSRYPKYTPFGLDGVELFPHYFELKGKYEAMPDQCHILCYFGSKIKAGVSIHSPLSVVATSYPKEGATEGATGRDYYDNPYDFFFFLSQLSSK